MNLSSLYEDIDDDGYSDFMAHAQLLLSVIKIVTGGFKSLIEDFLQGCEKSASMRPYYTHSLFGCGQSYDKYYWDGLIIQLREHDFLTTHLNGKQIIIKITDKGRIWMYARPLQPLRLRVIGQLYPYFELKTGTPLPQSRKRQIAHDNSLTRTNVKVNRPAEAGVCLELLLNTIRSELVKQEGNDCAPFQIASNLAIQQMVSKKPVNIDEFRAAKIDGFSVVKIQKFAPSFVNAISNFKVI